MLALLVTLAPVPCAAGAGLELPALFSEHLVLQRETRAPLWGRAAPNARVELTPSWDGRARAVTADAGGRWQVELETPAAGGPYEIVLTSGAERRVLADVLVGEVWLASGQSNMEWTLGPVIGDGVEGWEEAVRTARDPELRVFALENALAPAPCVDVRASWVAAEPASAPAFSATAYFFARKLRAELGVPVGVITADWGGTPAEAWTRAGALAPFPEFAQSLARQAEAASTPGAGATFGPSEPSVLWNAMIAPLAPAAIRGVIWYQGEANCGRADAYARLFATLIGDWRAAFRRPELPFLFVQIAPFAYSGDQGEAGRLRDAQRRTLALAHTGMAVTMDIGDPADIHPKKKREVGERLALWALAGTYGRELECAGPLYRAQRVEGSALRLEFTHAAGLTSRGEPLQHLTIAGPDRVFHPATARIEGESLVVTSPAVPAPVAARLGAGAADQTNLWNAAGLPAASFRTDDWP